MLAALVGAEEAGVYSVASRLALTAALALTAVLALLSPALARDLAGRDTARLQRGAALGAGLMAGLAFAVAAVLAAALPLLLPAFGPGFDAAAVPLLILLGGQVALAACGPAGALLALGGHNRALVAGALGAVILDILLCLVLVPVYGPVGAATATAATLVAQALVYAVVVRRVLGVDPTLLGALRVAWRRRGTAGREAEP
jgi:O-antigen/teichoic acid export membrane protein